MQRFPFGWALKCIAASLMLHLPPVLSADCSTKGQFDRAEIYYYGWDVLTRSRLSPDMIRRSPKIHVAIHDPAEVACFVDWLRLDELKDTKASAPMDSDDPRLVIDLFRSDRTRLTYYASRFNLVSEDGRKKRPVDESFRLKFVFR